MSKMLLAIALTVMIGGSAFAQPAEPGIEMGVTEIEDQETPALPPQPEVRVNKDRLSVDAQDAPFGDVMKLIGQEGGFEVKVATSLYDKKVTTTFSDVLLERGINRLLALINHKTFFIHYTTEGNISKVEVLSTETVPAARGGGAWSPAARPQQTPGVPAQAPARRRFDMGVGKRPIPGVTTVPPEPQRPQPSQPSPPMEMEEDVPSTPLPDFEDDANLPPSPPLEPDEPGMGGEEGTSGGVPFIAPRRAPTYIPKKGP